MVMNRPRCTTRWASRANRSIGEGASTCSPPNERRPKPPTPLPAPTRSCKSSCGTAAPSTCRRHSRAWGETRRCARRSRPSSCRRSEAAMEKWNMIIDVAECTNCQLCALAAMDEYVGNNWPGYAAPMPRHGHKWINILQKERGQQPMIDIAYVPTMCNHCDNAPCIKAAKGGTITKRADGIVIIDPVKAKGQKDLVAACPYG